MEKTKYHFKLCEQSLWFFNDVLRQLINEFKIDEDEALGRLNKRFGGGDYSKDFEYLFHDTPKDWAYFIYYGKNSQWWNKSKDELKPLPYP